MAYIDLPGTLGHVSTPDSAALSITGDMDLRFRIEADDWTPAADTTIASKYESGPNARTWILRLDTTGILQFFWSEDGISNNSASSSVGTGFSDGTAHWVRVTIDVDNGASDADITFYTADDEVSIPSSWSQLGTVQNHGSTTSLDDNGSAVRLGVQDTGTSEFEGKMWRAVIYDGIGGTIQLDAAPVDGDAGNSTFTEDSVNAATMTVVANSSIVAETTRTERQSMIGAYFVPGVVAAFFNPPDTASGLQTAERLAVAHWYAGITPSGAPAANTRRYTLTLLGVG